MSAQTERRDLLNRLVQFDAYPDEIARLLDLLPKDETVTPRVEIPTREVYDRLDDFASGYISRDTLSQWANLLLWQPDVKPEGDSPLLDEALRVMAHPDLHRFDLESAADWMERIKEQNP